MENYPLERLLHLEELTHLAKNAPATKFKLPTSADVSHWVQLLGHSPHDAKALLTTHRLTVMDSNRGNSTNPVLHLDAKFQSLVSLDIDRIPISNDY
ncbi:hypothetical protein IFR05_006246 [Cadophora sp. M221]|nr:hypothetical protein IFR05_006246 [Cadophora sp. M221]